MTLDSMLTGRLAYIEASNVPSAAFFGPDVAPKKSVVMGRNTQAPRRYRVESPTALPIDLTSRSSEKPCESSQNVGIRDALKAGWPQDGGARSRLDLRSVPVAPYRPLNLLETS